MSGVSVIKEFRQAGALGCRKDEWGVYGVRGRSGWFGVGLKVVLVTCCLGGLSYYYTFQNLRSSEGGVT